MREKERERIIEELDCFCSPEESYLYARCNAGTEMIGKQEELKEHWKYLHRRSRPAVVGCAGRGRVPCASHIWFGEVQ